MHICKKKVLKLLVDAGTPYSVEDVRNVCAGVSGANSDFRSQFGPANNPKEVAIKLPRESIDDTITQKIDSCK